jgi:hypothetical protein
LELLISMSNFKTRFKDYLMAANKEGSNKAKSYVRALDLLSEILAVEPISYDDCKNIWSVDSLSRLSSLYEEAKTQALKWDDSVWNIEGIPPSYLRDRFISAALASYIKFHNEISFDHIDIKQVFSPKTSSSQGFLKDTIKKDFIEAHAMTNAIDYFETNGYIVEDVSSQRNLGYDLRCIKNNKTLEVEVKGTTTNGDKVILTRNEVLNAKTSMNRCMLFVVHSIDIRDIDGTLAVNYSDKTIMDDWNPMDKDLEPLSYHYNIK